MLLIEREYGVRLHVRSVGKYLAHWGFTPQKPIRRACLVLGQEAVADKSNEITAIRDAKANYLLAAKANQPLLRQKIETFFDDTLAASLVWIPTPMSTRGMAV